MIRCISVRATQRPTLVRVRVGRRGSSQSLFTWFQRRSSLWSVAAITIDVERSAPLAPEKSSRPKIVIYSSFSGDCSGQRANVEPGSSEPQGRATRTLGSTSLAGRVACSWARNNSLRRRSNSRKTEYLYAIVHRSIRRSAHPLVGPRPSACGSKASRVAC